MPNQPSTTTPEDSELYRILVDYANDLRHLEMRDGKPPADAAIARLKLREEQARINEREYTWKLVNDIRYENITLSNARNEANDRLTDLQVKHDMAQLSLTTNKEER